MDDLQFYICIDDCADTDSGLCALYNTTTTLALMEIYNIFVINIKYTQNTTEGGKFTLHP